MSRRAVYRVLQPPFIMRLSDDKTSGPLLRCYNRFFAQRKGRCQPFVTFLGAGRKNTREGTADGDRGVIPSPTAGA